ncbi:MAG: hypothetical protein OES09_00115 [Gammaproteobacteria bacterium]|nr:hypothetical protein [Gammaproteobacteria bacterium]
MATLTVVTAIETGVDLTYGACAAGGDEFANDGDTILLVKNASGGDVDVTITAQTTTGTLPGMGSVTKANAVWTVNAAEDSVLGPFSTTAFNNANGRVEVGWESTTSVTCVAVQVDKAS